MISNHSSFLQTTRFQLDLQRKKPWIMGIVNLTPDSFSDGAQFENTAHALRHAEQLLMDGADILDIGGESTRPGSQAISALEELSRIEPVLKEVVRWNVPISVDTSKAQVMKIALDLGVDLINDIWALRQNGAQKVVLDHKLCGVCLMHLHQTPETMHLDHLSGDAVEKVLSFLEQRVLDLQRFGFNKARLLLDAGIGFGKTIEQNFSLLARQSELLEKSLVLKDLPWLAGWSRKSSLGKLTGLPVHERLIPSVTAAVLAIDRGAKMVRVHDVAQTLAALTIWQAVKEQEAKI